MLLTLLFFRNAQNVVKLVLGANTLSCTLYLLLHWFRYHDIYGFVIHILKLNTCFQSAVQGQNKSGRWMFDAIFMESV